MKSRNNTTTNYITCTRKNQMYFAQYTYCQINYYTNAYSAISISSIYFDRNDNINLEK